MQHSVKKTAKTKGGVIHPMTARAVSKLGEDIALARRARGIAAHDFAERSGISRATLYRLEHGDPGVSLNTLAMALHVLGRIDLLNNLLDPMADDVALMRMRQKVPKRIVRTKPTTSSSQKPSPPTDNMEW